MSDHDFFNGKNVLVAGGTGLVGRRLVQMLVERGARVRIASLDNGDRAHPQVEYVKCDLTYLDNCLRVCNGIDVVFNLLCTKGSPKTAVTKPASYYVPMIMYNTNLMEAARRPPHFASLGLLSTSFFTLRAMATTWSSLISPSKGQPKATEITPSLESARM